MRSRAKYWFLKPIAVKTRSGHTLILSMRDPNSKEVATEAFTIDEMDLDEIRWNDDARTEYADRLIGQFLVPIQEISKTGHE